ncbi:hypothetical protein C0Q70_19401 [Pomacea canaliculata]|uniref:Uncharacterized protein n=1 Tax=Pomacea canaliculata TaxID=400727 RepID=A0A2T7NJ85_POMCA|nr:hypothetical protein C0Q70_19401 [Pomacea canaliculata]
MWYQNRVHRNIDVGAGEGTSAGPVNVPATTRTTVTTRAQAAAQQAPTTARVCRCSKIKPGLWFINSVLNTLPVQEALENEARFVTQTANLVSTANTAEEPGDQEPGDEEPEYVFRYRNRRQQRQNEINLAAGEGTSAGPAAGPPPAQTTAPVPAQAQAPAPGPANPAVQSNNIRPGCCYISYCLNLLQPAEANELEALMVQEAASRKRRKCRQQKSRRRRKATSVRKGTINKNAVDGKSNALGRVLYHHRRKQLQNQINVGAGEGTSAGPAAGPPPARTMAPVLAQDPAPGPLYHHRRKQLQNQINVGAGEGTSAGPAAGPPPARTMAPVLAQDPAPGPNQINVGAGEGTSAGPAARPPPAWTMAPVLAQAPAPGPARAGPSRTTAPVLEQEPAPVPNSIRPGCYYMSYCFNLLDTAEANRLEALMVQDLTNRVGELYD